jgi:maleamate amidohydrolase
MVGKFEDHCWADVVTPDILNIYRAYERDVGVGPASALLLIDLYNLVYEGGPRPVRELLADHPSSCGEHAWAAIEPTRALLTAARAAGLPIIYCTQERRPEALPARTAATRRQINRIDGRSFEIREEFAPRTGDLIIYKQRASIFHGTALHAHLTQLGVRSLIVCGESTSGCVRASVVDGYSQGYQVAVAEECCFDRNPLSHKVNLFDMHHKYADVLHVQDVIDHLSGPTAA